MDFTHDDAIGFDRTANWVSPSSRIDPYRGDAAGVGIGGSVYDTMGGSAWTWFMIYY